MEKIDIREEVYKCSKCGLCASVCPIFNALKNEKYLPRGRFNILNKIGLQNKLSKNFINDLDICLNCNECKNFCPSNIDSVMIFTLLKSEYKKELIPFSTRYKLILKIKSILKHLIRGQQLYKITVKQNNIKSKDEKEKRSEKIAYFQGCFNRYINPSDKNAVINILNQNGYKDVKILNYCCGLPYFSGGELKKFDNNMQSIVDSIPNDVKYVVTSCDSCYRTLSNTFMKNGIKIIRLNDLIKSVKIDEKAVFHKPFTLDNYNGAFPIINQKGVCSFMENYFMLKHKDIFKKIIDNNFYKKEDIEGKIIVTSCNLTKWGLIECCQKKNINAKIYSLAEFDLINLNE